MNDASLGAGGRWTERCCTGGRKLCAPVALLESQLRGKAWIWVSVSWLLHLIGRAAVSEPGCRRQLSASLRALLTALPVRRQLCAEEWG